MRRLLFDIPLTHGWHLPIHSYGVMLVLGFLVALFLAKRRAKRAGLDPNSMIDLALVALCSGVIGARLFFVIENFKSKFSGPGGLIEAVKIWDGGLVFYGGFLAAAASIILFVRARKLSLLKTLDTIAAAGMIGLAFGRMGCYLNGCCFGRPTGLPWAVVFPADSFAYTTPVPSFILLPASELANAPAYMKIPEFTLLHPVQLYESFAALMLFVILDIYSDHKKRNGTVTLLVLTLYPILRFMLEFLRADTAVPHGLTTSQTVSLVVFVAAIAFWVLLYVVPERAEPEISRSERRAAERHKRKDEGPEEQG